MRSAQRRRLIALGGKSGIIATTLALPAGFRLGWGYSARHLGRRVKGVRDRCLRTSWTPHPASLRYSRATSSSMGALEDGSLFSMIILSTRPKSLEPASRGAGLQDVLRRRSQLDGSDSPSAPASVRAFNGHAHNPPLGAAAPSLQVPGFGRTLVIAEADRSERLWQVTACSEPWARANPLKVEHQSAARPRTASTDGGDLDKRRDSALARRDDLARERAAHARQIRALTRKRPARKAEDPGDPTRSARTAAKSAAASALRDARRHRVK